MIYQPNLSAGLLFTIAMRINPVTSWKANIFLIKFVLVFFFFCEIKQTQTWEENNDSVWCFIINSHDQISS